MQLNSVFENEWRMVEKAFDALRKLNILPLQFEGENGQETITEADLEQQLQSWQNDKFTIAVCGMVKSGKSTLLNALLFKDYILPTFDTPKTAKLTFINYTDKQPYFEVEFYDKKEWNKIENEMDKEAIQELHERVQFCAENFGINIREYVTDKRHPNECRKNLSELNEFVSVPMSYEIEGNCGKYTPFVKNVSVYINNENLRNLQIVDTPGLNDSNIINSIQTTEWIRNAHAVIYVLETRGPSKPDIKFFRRYFPACAKDTRIFVQNMIDTVPEYMDVITAMRNYGTQDIYKEMGLFGKDEVICSYSSLLVLAKQREQAKLEPTEDEKWALGLVDNDFNPDPNELAKAIAEKLYKNSGKVRVDRAYGEIKEIIRSKISQEKNSNLFKNTMANAYDLDQTSLDAKIKSYSQFCIEVSNRASKMNMNIDNETAIILGELAEHFDKIKIRVVNHIESELNRMNDSNTIKNRLPWIIKGQLHSKFLKMPNLITTCKTKIFNMLKNSESELLAFAAEHGLYEDFKSVEYNMNDYSSKIGDLIEHLNLIQPGLNDRLPGAFMDLFTKQTFVRNSASDYIHSVLDKIQDDFKKICLQLEEQSRKQMSKYTGYVQKWADDQSKELEKIKLSSKNAQQERQTLIEEANAHKENALKLETELKEIQKGYKVE